VKIRSRPSAGILAAVLTASGLVAGAAATSHADAVQIAAANQKRSVAPSAAQVPGPVPQGFGTWAELFAVQDTLNAAARRIVAARGAGYAGIVAAPGNRDLRVYWKGSVPASVRRLAGQLGVPVRFLPARFTEREMLAEAERLAADPEVRSVGPRVDGSGLTINVTGAGQQAMRSGTGVLAAGRMPLHPQPQPAPELFYSRQNDATPYWGGATYTVNGFQCSSGFAVLWNGVPRMLSAGHCGNNLNTVVDGGGDVVGDVLNDNDSRDTMMYDTRIEGETFEGGMYTGPASSQTGVDVVDAVEDWVGNVVCTSGARSGEHCGIVVTDVNQVVLGRFPMVMAEISAGCASAKGDSGGPVFTYGTGGAALGRGIISAGKSGTGQCPNAPPSQSSRFLAYAPLLRPAGDAAVGALQFYQNAEIL